MPATSSISKRGIRLLRMLTVVLIGVVAAATGAYTPSADAAPARPSLGAYDVFTGPTDDFYVVPTPLPPGAPGELIRVQDVASTPTTVTKRIMYHSIDGAGRDRAVTGTITYPTAPAPAGGWPVVSIANGTVGLGPQCAPSRTNTGVYTFGLDAVGVDSDYIGEGPVGESQAYLSRESEAHSVLDAVRAARNLKAANAGDQVVVLGGSQGGHGALSTNELAASYAPELTLLGTVALAPAAMFDRTYGQLDELVTRVVGAMALTGIADEHPEINLSDYLTPAGLNAINQIRTKCTADIIPIVLGVPFDGFYAHDPKTTEPAASIMRSNDVGNVRSDSPVLLIQGTNDTTVFPARTRDLYARLCATGQVVEFREIPGADHNNVTQKDLTYIEAWFADRLAGVAARSTCTDQPPATTASTTTIAAAPTTTGAIAPARATPREAARQPNTLVATGAPSAVLTGMALLLAGTGLALLMGTHRRRRTG